MRILALGSGVVGVTSAYYLARAGHEVTVVDRRPAAGMERASRIRGRFRWAIRAVSGPRDPRQGNEGVVCGRGRNPTPRLWPAIFSGEIDVLRWTAPAPTAVP